VLVPNSTAANHLNEHFGKDLTRLWRKQCGDAAGVIEVTLDLGTGRRATLAE
jgi:hypothetical protein